MNVLHKIDDVAIDRVAQPVSDWIHERTGVTAHRQARLCGHAEAASLFGILLMVRHAFHSNIKWVLIIAVGSNIVSLFRRLQMPKIDPKLARIVGWRARCVCQIMICVWLVEAFVDDKSARPLDALFLLNQAIEYLRELLSCCNPNPPRRRAAAADIERVWA